MLILCISLYLHVFNSDFELLIIYTIAIILRLATGSYQLQYMYVAISVQQL